MRKLKDKLIRLLGGYTEREVDLYREIAEESRERAECWKIRAHNLAWENAQLKKTNAPTGRDGSL